MGNRDIYIYPGSDDTSPQTKMAWGTEIYIYIRVVMKLVHKPKWLGEQIYIRVVMTLVHNQNGLGNRDIYPGSDETSPQTKMAWGTEIYPGSDDTSPQPKWLGEQRYIYIYPGSDDTSPQPKWLAEQRYIYIYPGSDDTSPQPKWLGEQRYIRVVMKLVHNQNYFRGGERG